MLVTGIVNHTEKCDTVNLVSAIFQSTGKKISVLDTRSLVDLDEKKFRGYIKELDKNNVEILIFKINLSDIEMLIQENFQFDIIIYTEKADELNEEERTSVKELKRRLFYLLNEKGTAIINVDDVELVEYLEKMKHDIITYGFNSNACVSTSSVGDTIFTDNFLCCLQRNISDTSGHLIEPQEYMINISSEDINAYDVLAAASFAIIGGIDLNTVKITGRNLSSLEMPM